MNVLALSICTRESLKLMKSAGVTDGHIIHISRYTISNPSVIDLAPYNDKVLVLDLLSNIVHKFTRWRADIQHNKYGGFYMTFYKNETIFSWN